jgi:hypothetical protein
VPSIAPLAREGMVRRVGKLVRVGFGAMLVVLGALLSIPGIPGPGVLLIFFGLSVLSTDSELARRAVEWLKGASRRALERWRGRGVAG